MSTIGNVSDLRVIGYNDVLEPALLPCVVAPVFAVVGNPDRILFPPFRLVGELVIGGAWDDAVCWRELVVLKEMTAVPKPFPARPDYELWIDLHWAPHYELRSTATATLKALARERLKAAWTALARDERKEALREAAVAFNADTHQFDSLAIKAAICRLEGKHGEAGFLAEMAADCCSPESFERLVQVCLDTLNRAASATGVASLPTSEAVLGPVAESRPGVAPAERNGARPVQDVAGKQPTEAARTLFPVAA